MSSSARFASIIYSAYKNNDTELMRNAFNEFQQSQCYYPTRQRIYDAHEQVYKTISIPCGKCYHCMESKVNEWVTRMYAHAEDFKRVYFVTLTYRSFTDATNPVNVLLLNKLQDAIWHRDAFNSTRHMSYNPCLLVKKHYQDFLKRLRRYTGLNDISYVLSGEYGHQYGRPHFHLILFTNGELIKDDIIRAWSVCLWRKDDGTFEYRKNQKYNGQAFNFPIGRVDFNDLVTNGTFNTAVKVRVDGQYLNAARCFAYVCKYVCKRDTANLDRVKLAYNNLFERKTFVKFFSNDLEFAYVKEYLQKVGYPFEQIPGVINGLKQYKYEKVIFNPQSSIYSTDLQQTKNGKLFGCDAVFNIYPEAYFDFRDKYSQFCEFSRGCGIGSVYAINHLSEFKEGVFNKPLLQDSGFVVPSYFRRKAKNDLFGLRICHKTCKSTSYSLGGLIDMQRRLHKSLETGLPPREYLDLSARTPDVAQALSNPNRFLYDLSTGTKCIFIGDRAASYKYNRHTRHYDCVKTQPIADWVRYWCVSLLSEFERYKSNTNLAKLNERFRDAAFCQMTDAGVDYLSARDAFVDRQDYYLHHRQIMYHDLHKSVE